MLIFGYIITYLSKFCNSQRESFTFRYYIKATSENPGHLAQETNDTERKQTDARTFSEIVIVGGADRSGKTGSPLAQKRTDYRRRESVSYTRTSFGT